MLDDKKRAEFEQSNAAMAEIFPSLWKSLFDGCVKQGFTEVEAMQLVKTYILGQSSGGVKP